MTTRRAARNRHSDGNTPSFNGSAGDDNSRRGSFEDFRPITSPSDNSQVSATQTIQLSGVKNVGGIIDGPTNGVQHSIETPRDGLLARPVTPETSINAQLSPSRKRKRQSQSSPEILSSHIPSVAITYAKAGSMQRDKSDHAEINALSQSPSQQRSSDSSRSDNGADARDDLVTAAPSTDITPTPSVAVSPASSISGSDNDIPGNSLEAAGGDLTGGTETQQEVDELDDVDVDEEDVQGMQGQTTGTVRRRIGGRKRAPHADPKVEAAMRRQAHLKTAYRHLGKALKPLLDEIAGRTLETLQDEDVHMDAAEFSTVQHGLDDALARRKQLIRTQNDLDLNLWDEVSKREQSVQHSKTLQQFEECQDLALTTLEQEIAKIERTIHITNGNTGYETEDEDGVVPRTKCASYRYQRGDALDSKYDSRSRVILHTRRAIEDVQLRSKLARMQQEFEGTQRKDTHEPFTTMDCSARDLALARREAVDRVDVLAKAAERVEQIAAIPIIPNKDAIGLNVLGDLATRPSIRSAMPVKQQQHPIGNHIPPQHFMIPLASQSSQLSPPTLLSPGFPREPPDLLDRSMPHSFAPRQIGPLPPGPQHFMFSPQFRAPEQRPLVDMSSSSVPLAFTPRPEISATSLNNFRAYDPEPDWQEQRLRAERVQQDRPPASYRPWLQDPHLTADRSGEDSARRKSSSNTLNHPAELPRVYAMPVNGRFRDFGSSEVKEERPASRIHGQHLPMSHHHPSYNTFGGEHMYMRAPPPQHHQGSPQSHSKVPIDPARSPRSRNSSFSQQTPEWRDRAASTESGNQTKGFDKPNKADKAGQPKRKKANRNREHGKTLLSEPQVATEAGSLPGPPSYRASLSDHSGPKGVERFPFMQQQWQSQAEPQPAPRPPQSPATAYALPAGYGPAPSTNYFHPHQTEYSQPYERNPPPHHRPALPGLLHSTLWPSTNSSNTPLFAIPQEQTAPTSAPPPPHQPPPPGVHSDSYRNQFPAAPPSRLRPGPQPPSSASGSGYGGPAIAPARYDQRFSFAGGFAPPPAFAQQEEHQRQQHRNGNEINRRRTQSDGQRPMKVIHHRPGKS
nr:hypothetical protein CFP56_28646 [Quercus suber]